MSSVVASCFLEKCVIGLRTDDAFIASFFTGLAS